MRGVTPSKNKKWQHSHRLITVNPSRVYFLPFKLQKMSLPLISILLILAFLTLAYATNSSLIQTEEIPEGFEEFGEAQTGVVDIFLSNRFLISDEVNYDLDTLTFSQPENIIEKINDLIPSAEINQAFRKAFNIHAEKICLDKNVPNNCGFVSAEDVELIFDEGQFRIDLFINQKHLKLLKNKIVTHLPSSFEQHSGITSVALDVSGGDAIEYDYNIKLDTTLALRQKRVEMINFITSKNRFLVTKLLWHHEGKDHSWNTGLFNSLSTPLGTSLSMIGTRYFTSLKRRVDVSQRSGQELSLFLNNRSIVQLWHQDRLYHSEWYDPGNQLIDTQALPTGTYEVDIKIKDPVRGLLSETRLYSKSYSLPPSGLPQYFIEAGCLQTQNNQKGQNLQQPVLPTCSNQHAITGGYRHRITPKQAMGLETIVTSNNHMMKLSTQYVGRHINFKTSGSAAKHGYAYNIGLNGAILGTNVAMNLTHIKRKPFPSSSQINTTPLLGSTAKQASLNLNRNFHNLQLNLRGTWQAAANNKGEQFSFSPSVNYQIFKNFDQEMNINAEYINSQDEEKLQFTLDWQFEKNGRPYNTYAKYNKDYVFQESNTSLGLRHSRRLWEQGQRSTDINIIAEETKGNQRLDVSNIYKGDKINLDAQYDWRNDKNSGQHQFYSANFMTTLLYDKQGILAANLRRSKSAAVLQLKGSVENSLFDVKINNSSRGSVANKVASAIPLQPYQKYNVQLLPDSEEMLDFDANSKEIILYPGQFKRLYWDIEQSYILIAQLQDQTGKLITNANISGATNPAEIDELGFLQLEVIAGKTMKVETAEGNNCQFTVPKKKQGDVVYIADEMLVCKRV